MKTECRRELLLFPLDLPGSRQRSDFPPEKHMSVVCAACCCFRAFAGKYHDRRSDMWISCWSWIVFRTDEPFFHFLLALNQPPNFTSHSCKSSPSLHNQSAAVRTSDIFSRNSNSFNVNQLRCILFLIVKEILEISSILIQTDIWRLLSLQI